MIQKYYTKDNFVKSKQDESPKTPYGLALDIAQQKVEDEEGKRWHTDEYALARALLDVQPYISSLKNDLKEAEQNINANARDAANCRAALEEKREYLRNCFSALREALQFCDLISQDDDGLNPIATNAIAVAERIRNLLMRTK